MLKKITVLICLIILLVIARTIKPQTLKKKIGNNADITSSRIIPYISKGFNNIYADALLIRILISPTEKASHNSKEKNSDEEKESTKLEKTLKHFGFYVGQETSAQYMTNEEAATLFETILLIDKNYEYGYKNLFYHFSLLKSQPQIAERLLIKWIKIMPNNADLYKYLTYNSIFNSYKLTETKLFLEKMLYKVKPKHQKSIIRNIISINQQNNSFYQKIYTLKAIKASLEKSIDEEKLDEIISELTIKSTLEMLNKGADIYIKLNNKYPNNIDDIKGAKLLDSFSLKFINKLSHFIKWDKEKLKFVIIKG